MARADAGRTELTEPSFEALGPLPSPPHPHDRSALGNPDSDEGKPAAVVGKPGAAELRLDPAAALVREQADAARASGEETRREDSGSAPLEVRPKALARENSVSRFRFEPPAERSRAEGGRRRPVEALGGPADPPPHFELRLHERGYSKGRKPLSQNANFAGSAGQRNGREDARSPGGTMSRLPIHPERVCWGCDRHCPARDLACGNGSVRTPHPRELWGPDFEEPVDRAPAHDTRRETTEPSPEPDSPGAPDAGAPR